MIKYILKGVDIRNPNLTRNPRIWRAYLCWCISTWMMFHKPIYPNFIRGWAYRYYGNRRYHLHWRTVAWWQKQGYKPKPSDLPLPWWLGEAALGMFVPPWNRLQRWFSSGTHGLSHRCEFTDKQSGALYTGSFDPFMERAFEQFIENISQEGVQNGL